jgi:DNA invertase Pin-like site-specific DNA recombinase
VAAVVALDTMVDRLARDLIVQEQILAEVWRMKARAFTCADGEAAYLADDSDDPSRKLIRQVLGAVAEYERSMIALRLRAGRLKKAAEGGYAFGAPGFGHRASNGSLEPLDAEQFAVARMVALRNEGRSYREICAALDAEGHRPRRAERWSPATVRNIVVRAEREGVNDVNEDIRLEDITITDEEEAEHYASFKKTPLSELQ